MWWSFVLLFFFFFAIGHCLSTGYISGLALKGRHGGQADLGNCGHVEVLQGRPSTGYGCVLTSFGR